MVEERQKRLIELYEKGVLTKEEAKACFMELEEEPDFLFVEEKTRLSFSLPSLKIFSSSKLKQDFHFSDVESMSINLKEGKIICDSPPQAFAWELFEKHNSDKRSLPQIG